MANSLGISAPYLNLMESNKRRVSAALLPKMAELLEIDLEDLTGTTERRQMDDLEDLASDELFQEMELEPEFSAEIVGRYPGWAQAILRLGAGYRDNQQANAMLSDRLNRDPELGEAVHRMLTHITSIRSTSEILKTSKDLQTQKRQRFRNIIAEESEKLSIVAQKLVSAIGADANEPGLVSSTDQVDDFIFNSGNYFPRLESVANELAVHLNRQGDPFEGALVHMLETRHGVQVTREARTNVDVSRLRNQSYFDAESSRLILIENASESTRRFQMARTLAQLQAHEIIQFHVENPELTTDAARSRAFAYLSAYVASAMLFPYERFLEAATSRRYDIELLCQQFGASFEQVAHRLVTLHRPGDEGIPFAFLRSDPAGFVTKRFPVPGFPLPRHGNACPLWAIYQAFQLPGRIIRQLVQFPAGDRYLFVARTVNKEPASFHEPDFLHSVMLMCDALHADKTVYADGLDMQASEFAKPVGPSCRLCPRSDCTHRQELAMFNYKHSMVQP